MNDWQVFADETKILLGKKSFLQAQCKIQEGLDRFPNQVTILSIANDVYRASGNREKSLDFAQGLIYHHPDNWIGYGRAVQDLLALKRFDEAQIKMQEGLDRFPNQITILSIASDVYRASGNRQKALDFAQGLIYHHPGNWIGYGRAAQDLLALKRFDEAQARIQEGLGKFPNQVNILTIANDVYRASGNRQKALDFAQDLIHNHPDNWIGYGRSAQDLFALKRFDEAQARIQEGLGKFPNQVKILTIANDVYRASGNWQKALDFAQDLIHHHPDNWIGYGRAAKDLLALNRLDEAQTRIQEALDRFPNQVNILTIANDVYRASGNRQKALDFAQGLIHHHPDNWIGYGRAAKDLLALNRLDEAQTRIQEALDRFPNQVNILTIANDVYRASGNRQKALDFAQGLIHHHPDNWIGYGRAVQELLALNRLDEARIKIQEALEKFPNQGTILSMAKAVERASGEPENP
jgi:tetratricopeptide (TPR) repeat protein